MQHAIEKKCREEVKTILSKIAILEEKFKE